MNRSWFSRRAFLKATAAAAGYAAVRPTSGAPAPAVEVVRRLKIEPFDYRGVRLRDSRWRAQYQLARDFYLGVSDDDILHGFRADAGLPAPGQPLGGWCEKNSNTVFGQWLSGMSRMYPATGDDAIRNKAVKLADEWAKTIGGDGNCRMGHYPYDKLVGGLVDLKLYADHDHATAFLERATEWASKALSRERVPADRQVVELHSGRPLEWYTLSENLYRAFQTSGNELFKKFAEVWHYDAFWDKFADSSAPADAYGVHAYSHVNSLSSAAMTYSVSGDTRYLQVVKNAYDFLQNTQCYATGGYGPVERLMPTNGNLGKALELQSNTCETPCCSWAGFKLARYLLQFTGEARYGDWIERLLYNGIGAALPITTGGKNFYYADYRVAGGIKHYARSTYTCCSGTYIQNMAEYHNLIYFKDASSLYVNLYLPSEVVWSRPDGAVNVVQETAYPEAETSTLTLELTQPSRFALKCRVPAWSRDMSAEVNGTAANVACQPGSWASIDRTWSSGDRIEIRVPLPLRYQAVDRWHPDRVAVVRGPVVLVHDASVHEAVHALPANDEELNQWLVPDDKPGVFSIRPPDGTRVVAKFQPFYAVPEVNTYRMYFDRGALPFVLW